MMEVSISYAKKNFYKLADILINKQEKLIVVTKYGKPVVQLSLVTNKEKVVLTNRERDSLLKTIDNPPEPNEDLKKLLK